MLELRCDVSCKVVFCAYDHHDACGGPYAWAIHFARALREAGIEIAVLIFCRGGKDYSPIASALINYGIEVEVLDSSETYFIEDQTKWTIDTSFKYKPDVFIANLVLPAFYASRWLRTSGIKTIGVVHSDPEHDDYYDNMLRHFGNSGNKFGLDNIVCVSKYIKNIAENKYGTTSRLDVISCGTPVYEKRTVKGKQVLRLLYAGKLANKAKKIHELTEAFIAATSIPGVSASICGNGPEKSWLEARLSDQNRVKYLGYIKSDQIQKVLREHHAIVLLSDYEGLPMALIEGMACGLVPIVLDKPGGVREVVINGKNGLIVKDRGQDFIEVVRRLMDHATWTRLSDEAVNTVTKHYQHEVVFGQWIRLIKELSAQAKLSWRGVRCVRLTECKDWFAGSQVMRPPLAMRMKKSMGIRILHLRSRLKIRTRFRSLFFSSKNSQNRFFK